MDDNSPKLPRTIVAVRDTPEQVQKDIREELRKLVKVQGVMLKYVMDSKEHLKDMEKQVKSLDSKVKKKW